MLSLLLIGVITGYNDANWVSFGGAGAFVPHKTIHMLGEDISIVMYDDKIHVRVFFSFENRGPATTVKMAFPFSTVNWNKDLVRSFSSKVDGKATSVEKLVNVPILPGEDKVLSGKWGRNVVYVKSVDFEKGEKRTVLVDYTTGRGLAGGGYLFDEYIISTGATWAGPIGTISVSVDWNKARGTSRPDLEFYRRSGKDVETNWNWIDKKHATATITNVEPDFELSLGSVIGFWNVWVDGVRLDSGHGVAAEYGPCLVGDPTDPLAVIYGLDHFIFDWAKRRGMAPDKDSFIGQYVTSAPDSRTLVLSDRRKLLLRREARDVTGATAADPEAYDLVYLKDFIEALGGQMAWDESQDRINITLPK